MQNRRYILIIAKSVSINAISSDNFQRKLMAGEGKGKGKGKGGRVRGKEKGGEDGARAEAGAGAEAEAEAEADAGAGTGAGAGAGVVENIGNGNGIVANKMSLPSPSKDLVSWLLPSDKQKKSTTVDCALEHFWGAENARLKCIESWKQLLLVQLEGGREVSAALDELQRIEELVIEEVRERASEPL